MNTADPSVSYGYALAEAVATALDRGEVLAYGHRDYCGMGLCLQDGHYIYSQVFDGYFPTDAEWADWASWTARVSNDRVHEALRFATRADFVDWLSRQSDDSLSGAHLQSEFLRANQRLDGDRLRAFAKTRPPPAAHH